MGILDSISWTFYQGGVMTWDVFLTLGNLVQFSRPVGKVTPAGHPGFAGHWPEYKPQQEGDSRCSYPALNALASYGTSARGHRPARYSAHRHASPRALLARL